MTYYDVLGISSSAMDSEIKKAYHQMIIAFHPDKYQGDKQFALKKTHEIIEAYKVLCNPSARKAYDNSINMQNSAERKGTSASASGYKPQGDTKRSAASGFHTFKPTGFGIKTALYIICALLIVFVILFFIIVLTNAAK